MHNNGMDFGMFSDHGDNLEEQAYFEMLKKVIDELQENVRILYKNQETLSEQNKKLRDALLELCDAHDVTVDEVLKLAVYVGANDSKKKKKKKEKK